MAAPHNTKRKHIMHPVPGFDVTCVIGRVNLDEQGEHTPVEAAMLLIGRHNAPGIYSFPSEDGGTVAVTVDHMGPEDAPDPEREF